jgi:hypothetical protein
MRYQRYQVRELIGSGHQIVLDTRNKQLAVSKYKTLTPSFTEKCYGLYGITAEGRVFGLAVKGGKVM